jgi:hypothetical protein
MNMHHTLAITLRPPIEIALPTKIYTVVATPSTPCFVYVYLLLCSKLQDVRYIGIFYIILIP